MGFIIYAIIGLILHPVFTYTFAYLRANNSILYTFKDSIRVASGMAAVGAVVWPITFLIFGMIFIAKAIIHLTKNTGKAYVRIYEDIIEEQKKD